MASGFRFFDMPPKLRNFVYRQLHRQGQQTIRLPVHNQEPYRRVWHAAVRYCVLPALLLVSKEFREEYENDIYRHATLRMLFNASVALLPRAQPVKLPGRT